MAGDSVVHLALLGFKVYCWGNEGEAESAAAAEEVPLLLLPCLDYGCSRCKCVSPSP